MMVTMTTVGPFAENSYLVVDEPSGEAVYIDPGAEGERLLDVLHRSDARLTAIWLTHAHIDHIGGIAALRREIDVPIYLHPLDRPLYERGSEIAALYGLAFDVPPEVDLELADDDRLHLGTTTFTVAHVPGHAPGHVAFIGDAQVFGGDLLFAGSVGRTDLPFCNPDDMALSLARAATWESSLIVHPGHGPSTTIGHEVATNGFLQGAARPIRAAGRR
jgi:glyoxylase-like metal-dependent hydrolase (beta-lactamase superfamily II)